MQEQASNKRPAFKLLTDDILKKIVTESIEILDHTGVQIQDDKILEKLSDKGAIIDKKKLMAFIPSTLVESALKTVPSSISLYDRSGNLSVTLQNDESYFTPLAGAVKIWDAKKKEIREPIAKDCFEFIKLTDALEHIKIQSPSHYPIDINEKLAPVYRIYLCLRYGSKPCWGTMVPTKENVKIVKELLYSVRGSRAAVKEKPLLFLSCTPVSPLKWSKDACNVLEEGSKNNIPVAIVPSPSVGATSPIFLGASITQILSEFLSGLVISQCIRPNAKVIFGAAPEIMDMRNASTAMAAIESIMINISCTEIAKSLEIPNFVVTGVSDSKRPDFQAGLESGIGMVLAALSGANIIVGPGGMGQCLVSSLEKMIADNEICGMAQILKNGININKETKIAEDLFLKSIFKTGNFLLSENTLNYFKKELYYPDKAIDRNCLEDWIQIGCPSTEVKSNIVVKDIMLNHKLEKLDKERKKDIDEVIKQYGKEYNISRFPII